MSDEQTLSEGSGNSPLTVTVVEPLSEYSVPTVRQQQFATPAVVAASAYSDRVASLIETAIANKTDPAALRELVVLQEHVMARQAEAEFDAAMANFRAECPKIWKNRKADVKNKEGNFAYSYHFADLEHVEKLIRPLCEKYGFTYSFQQAYVSGIATITCIVKHCSGHKVNTQFAAPIDDKATMNSMQKSAAVTTFGRRYALVLAFGLPISLDTDGHMPPEPPETVRDKTQPATKTRTERRQEPPKPAITKDEMADLYGHWNTAEMFGEGTPAIFVGWARKKLDPPPLLDPTDTASWRTVISRADFDALRKELP